MQVVQFICIKCTLSPFFYCGQFNSIKLWCDHQTYARWTESPALLPRKTNALMVLLNEGIVLRHLDRVLFLFSVAVCKCVHLFVCYRSLVMVEVCVGINAKWVWVANGDYWRCIVELFKPFTLLCVLIWSHKHTNIYIQTDRRNWQESRQTLKPSEGTHKLFDVSGGMTV